MFISPTNITTGTNTTLTHTGAAGCLLDQYPGADVAYSLRRLISTYNGPICRVRRESDDIEADVHFDSRGGYSLESPVDNFSSASSSTVLGEFANSGGIYSNPDSETGGQDMWMTVWYDQTQGANTVGVASDGRNGRVTTASKQPRMLNGGNLSYATGGTAAGVPAGYLDGYNNLYGNPWGTIAHPNTVTQVGQQLQHDTNRYWWTGTTSVTRNIVGSFWSGNDSGLYAGGDGGDPDSFLTIDDSNEIDGNKIRYGLFNGSNSAFSLTDIYGDTTDIYGALGSNSQYGARCFAKYNGGGSANMYGYFNECIFWPVNVSSGSPLLSANLISQLNDYYQIN